MQIAYVYGPRGLVSQVLGGQTYAYFHNLQGSTVALVDSTGVMKNSYQYEPFGQKLGSTSEQIVNSFAYLGGFSVPSVGHFSITTYRVYDAKLGRFGGQDLLGSRLSIGYGHYLYGAQSPIRSIDPSGLFTLAALGNAVTQTFSQLPSFIECSGSFFRDEAACQQQGFSSGMIQAGQVVGSVAADVVGTATGTLPLTQAVTGAFDWAKAATDSYSAVKNLIGGTLTEQQATNAVLELAFQIIDANTDVSSDVVKQAQQKYGTVVGSAIAEMAINLAQNAAQNGAQALYGAVAAPATRTAGSGGTGK
jgi:RHS repeat-associated protein